MAKVNKTRPVEMEGRMKVVKTFETALSGVGEIACNDPGDWNFDVTAAAVDGRDEVTVRLTAHEEALPPHFQVFFRVSGARVQNVWTCNHDNKGDARHVWPKLWCPQGLDKSFLTVNTPIAAGFNSTEEAPVALACSEVFSPIMSGVYLDDETCDLIARCEFFQNPVLKIKKYETSILLDRRGKSLPETVLSLSDWIFAKNKFEPANVPEASFDALYSSWYAYLQNVCDEDLEQEAKLAAELGMKVMILDDGWQKVHSVSFYSAVGDWQPARALFPDMKAHVAKVHAAGMKYMLWFSVPFIGDETEAWKRFEGKFLKLGGGTSPGRIGVIDPRFPEVREYLIGKFERAVGEWDFDGVKLDFINCFSMPDTDPAVEQNYAGRDYRDLQEAVDRLMKDILARLKAIKPDVLIEFRQPYIGPAILQYGTMLRASDCPADPCANRKRICDLRLTSGKTAVHSDMLVWSKDETPEGAALPILNVLYSTIQYSMILATIRPDHRDVIRHWISFSEAHREALLKGKFTPHHAENGYTWIEGESAAERIITSYANDACIRTGAPDRSVYIVNATGTDAVLVDSSANAVAELFDVIGRPIGSVELQAGLARIAIPQSGYAKLTWSK